MEGESDYNEGPLNGVHRPEPIIELPTEGQGEAVDQPQNELPSAVFPSRYGISTIKKASPRSSSSYTLACDQSLMSREVDRWIRGSPSPTENTGVQGSGTAVVQRSTLATETAFQGPGAWYILALMLPLFNVNNCGNWRCSPSTILGVAEVCLSQLGRACGRVRRHIRHLAENQISRELFATAMDVVLVVYAMGFLALSMYQTAVNR